MYIIISHQKVKNTAVKDHFCFMQHVSQLHPGIIFILFAIFSHSTLLILYLYVIFLSIFTRKINKDEENIIVQLTAFWRIKINNNIHKEINQNGIVYSQIISISA